MLFTALISTGCKDSSTEVRLKKLEAEKHALEERNKAMAAETKQAKADADAAEQKRLRLKWESLLDQIVARAGRVTDERENWLPSPRIESARLIRNAKDHESAALALVGELKQAGYPQADEVRFQLGSFIRAYELRNTLVETDFQNIAFGIDNSRSRQESSKALKSMFEEREKLKKFKSEP